MCTLEKRIEDLIQFYVKENYKYYLQSNNLSFIEESDIPKVVDKLYTEKKLNIQKFVIDSLKVMLQDEMPEEYIVKNILSEVFRDDELCKNRVSMELKIHQQKISSGKVDYNKI